MPLYLPSATATATEVYRPESYGAAGDGSTDDAVALQACADAISTAGGGIMQLGPKTYITSVPIYIRSNTIVQGCGMNKSSIKATSGVTYGPSSAGVASTFACLWLADAVDLTAGTTTAASNVLVRDLRCEPRESLNGSTGYALPITIGVYLGRLASGQIAKNVGVERVWVEDCGAGVALGQRGTPSAAVALADLHKNLWVRDCRVDTARNKAIELQQCYASRIVNNVCFNVNHGPQFIHENQDCEITGNHVEFNDYGIGVANANKRILVANNTVRFTGNFPSAGGAFPYNYTSFSSYPVGYNFKVDGDVAYTGFVYIEDIECRGNIVDMSQRGAGDGRAWSFGGNSSADDVRWRRFTFIGDKYINCKPQIGRGIESAPAGFTIADIFLEGNIMAGFIGSDAASVSNVYIRAGCVTAGVSLANATGWRINHVLIQGGLTLEASTTSCIVQLNTTASGSVTNNGTGNTVSSNFS